MVSILVRQPDLAEERIDQGNHPLGRIVVNHVTHTIELMVSRIGKQRHVSRNRQPISLTGPTLISRPPPKPILIRQLRRHHQCWTPNICPTLSRELPGVGRPDALHPRIPTPSISSVGQRLDRGLGYSPQPCACESRVIAGEALLSIL